MKVGRKTSCTACVRQLAPDDARVRDDTLSPEALSLSGSAHGKRSVAPTPYLIFLEENLQCKSAFRLSSGMMNELSDHWEGSRLCKSMRRLVSSLSARPEVNGAWSLFRVLR